MNNFLFTPQSSTSLPDSDKLNLRLLSFALLTLIARAVLLLSPILYALSAQGKPLPQLLQENLFYHLYYLLAFFDLLCFIELYYVKQHWQKNALSSTPCSIFLSVTLAQALTLNAFFVGCAALFLYQNRAQILASQIFKKWVWKNKLLVWGNVLFLAGNLALFYYMLSIYLSRRG